MKTFLITILLALTSNAYSQSYNIQFEPKTDYTEKNIRWVVLDDISAFCSAKMNLTTGQRILACSEYNNRMCIIYTGRTTDMAQVGHEIRHCFEGQWHR
jgi:hypothetical protein